MVNTSKILTVSYGTFSCTLEGFDDSFNMMKAIAEYFRDLAQDDRYFGAEPPTPDAEMLARIAEREVARRVEARMERGAVVLRPTEEAEPAVATPPAAVEAPKPAPAPVVEPVAEPVVAAAPEVIEEPEELIEDEPEQAVIPEPAPVAPKLDEESVAAKLSRIRAVVSRNAEAAAQPPAYSEDEHAEDASDATAASIAAALRDTSEQPMDLDEDDAFEDLDEDDSFEDLLEDDDQPEDPQLAADIAEAEAEPEVAEEAPARTRVIRMKRSDFDAAVASGALSTDDNDGLSAEDEQDLLAELARVESELSGISDPIDEDTEDEDDFEAELDSIFAEDEKPAAPAAPVGKAETDVGRLMDKARVEMDRPEGAHRRSAIAHLRAAVQATRAETEAGGGLNRGDDSLHAYRDDLNSVVRPRRPRSAEPEAEHQRRPVTKPAPLKLVAEQRVDAASPAQAQVVRPRRVSLAEIQDEPVPMAAQDDGDGFAAFAEKVGVKNLSELMEAAASYMSYVEGRQKFSRPQLMNKARQVEEYQFSREDGLRSFGQLLRQGKIEKLKGGRFTVDDDLIGFKPDARAAG